MKKEIYTGEYTKAFVSKIPMDYNSIEAKKFKEKLDIQPNEAVYIYSFKENKMVFANGFKQIFGIEDDQLGMTDMLDIHTNEISEFLNEINDKTLHQIHHKTSYEGVKTIMIINILNKITKQYTPVLRSVTLFESDENNNLISILTRYKKSKDLKINKITPYGVVKKEKNNEFLKKINFNLTYKNAISIYEIEIIEMLEKEFDNIEIQEKLGYSEKELNDIISNLLVRFKIATIPELISFAKKNYLLPNPFPGEL